MGRYFWLATAMMMPSPALAQSDVLKDLSLRVAALERQNAALKQEVERLSGRGPVVATALPEPAEQQLPVSAPLPVRPPANLANNFQWNGPYVGINAGLITARYDFRSPDITRDTHASGTDAAFGAQLGVRWQSGPLVTGIEIGASFPQGSIVVLPVPSSSAPSGNQLLPLEMRVNARLTGQMGFAAGPFLAYGTAGVQVSNIRFDDLAISPSRGVYRDGNATGILYGVGVAAHLNRSFSLELEAVETDPGLLLGFSTIEGRNRSVSLRLNRQFP